MCETKIYGLCCIFRLKGLVVFQRNVCVTKQQNDKQIDTEDASEILNMREMANDNKTAEITKWRK